MNLKLRHLAVFHAVMEEGSVSKAADRMGLTQPAVSIALTKLEEMLGYSLFNRSRGYFVPRPEAEQLHADAELALLAFERFEAHAQLIGKGAAGFVRVGSIGSTAINFLPDVIADFAAEHERVEVRLQVRSSAQIAYLVGNGQLDLGIVEAPVAAHSVDAVAFALPCVCILPGDDPLCALPALSPTTLEGRRLISVFEDHALDRKVRAAFVEAGVPWSSDIRSYFFTIMRKLVAKGTGVAIVDAINGRAELNDGVTWRPFEPALTYDLAVITRSNTDLPLSTREFRAMTTDRLAAFCDG